MIRILPFINQRLLIFGEMSDKSNKEKQEAELKKLRDKAVSPEIKASIEKKLKQLNKPFNK